MPHKRSTTPRSERAATAGRAAGLAARATASLGVAALSVTGMAACSSDPEPKARRVSAPTTAVPTRSSAPPSTNPLTGVGTRPTGPVIAVKIDDTTPGRPSLGVEKADVIYVQEVEGGLSRMVGVFASSRPRVRAVRSLRPSDPELLAQYGRIILVASGGAGSAVRALDRSDLHGVILDRRHGGFSRDPSRPAPYNVVSNLASVSASTKGDGVRDVGFSWAVRDPRLARAKLAATVRTRVGTTPVGFVWDSMTRSYVRTIAGRRLATGTGAPVAKPNVLVQFCQIRPDLSDVDVNGNPSMFTKSVGSGRVVLFRGGKRIEGRWSRRSANTATVFSDAVGKPLLLAPGGTFVALVRPGAPL